MQKMNTPPCAIFLGLSLILTMVRIHYAGEVYLVLGSDTAIWEGMNTAMYHCTYRSGLYTDPSRNAYKESDGSFLS